jgi:hypothetical protein
MEMPEIIASELPAEALLNRYREEGAYTDCYVTHIPYGIAHAEYIEAFYTTWLFKLERWLITRLVHRPSTDGEAGELALGRRGSFAAWDVEQIMADQLLMCDFQRRTRSWLMSVPMDNDRGTRLYFGSAVVPIIDRQSGEARMGFLFQALLGFHKLYSRALLHFTASKLMRNASRG